MRITCHRKWLSFVTIIAISTSGFAQDPPDSNSNTNTSNTNANRGDAVQTNRTQDSSANQPKAGRQTMELPSGRPLVTVSIDAPEEIRIGHPFEYTIRIQNSSNNVMLHDVVINQHASDSFEIQSSQVQGQESTASQSARQPSDRSDSQVDESANKAEQSAAESTANQNDAAKPDSTSDTAAISHSEAASDKPSDADSHSHSGETKQDGTRWRIARLNPGQSKTIKVKAMSDAEGTGNVCVAVESYSPALCLSTRFVKPSLEISKQAPESADICEEIQFQYVVKNTGSGDLQKFTVFDELPEGIATIDGHRKLEFTLDDGLKAGDTRKFLARLKAERTGEFISRATVEGPEGVSASSNRAGTQVRQAKLAIAITGPQAIEAGALATYTVRVTNQGDAPAPNTQLSVFFPRSADIVRSGKPQPSAQAVSSQSKADTPANNAASAASRASAGNTDKGETTKNTDQNAEENAQAQATKAESATDASSIGKQSSREQPTREQMGSGRWSLGTLKAGETVEMTYVLRPFKGGTLEQQATAQFVCGHQQNRVESAVEARTSTQVLALSGLRLVVIDDHDPVAAGQNVTYTITVFNQGKAPAHKIAIVATLPENVDFVSASGQSDGKQNEREVTFEPIDTLEAEKQAVWTVVAKVSEDVTEKIQQSISIKLDAQELDESVQSEEPTTLFQGGDSTKTNTSTQPSP